MEFNVYFVGFEVTYNKSHALYQRMLVEFIQWGIAEKCTTVNLGRTALDIKASLGAEPQRLVRVVREVLVQALAERQPGAAMVRPRVPLGVGAGLGHPPPMGGDLDLDASVGDRLTVRGNLLLDACKVACEALGPGPGVLGGADLGHVDLGAALAHPLGREVHRNKSHLLIL